MYVRGMGQLWPWSTPDPAPDSATNCFAAGGTFDPVSGDCTAKPGGALYTKQLAELAAAECPWYCLPLLNYPDTSPCSGCSGAGISLSSPGGVPAWVWALGVGAAALYVIPMLVKR